MNFEKQPVIAFPAVLLALALAACATPPPAKKISTAEIVQHDNAVGNELAQRFESQVKLKNDREVTVYLRALARKLSDASPDLKPTGVGVLLLRDKLPVWRNFGVPGNRVYLSVGLLRQFEFENEVAAVIAFELAHIQKRHLISRLEQAQRGDAPQASPSPGTTDLPVMPNLVLDDERLRSIDFFSPNGVFVFKLDDELEAVDGAVDLLYKSGYDPRGLIGVWKAYESNPRQSPYDLSTLNKLLERTRNAISGYAPLLNPIVRSAGFIAIQKRIKKL